MINTDSRSLYISSSTCGDAQCIFRLVCNRPRLFFWCSDAQFLLPGIPLCSFLAACGSVWDSSTRFGLRFTSCTSGGAASRIRPFSWHQSFGSSSSCFRYPSHVFLTSFLFTAPFPNLLSLVWAWSITRSLLLPSVWLFRFFGSNVMPTPSDSGSPPSSGVGFMF